jgi:transcriptional regulator with XRE-family HTH domain
MRRLRLDSGLRQEAVAERLDVDRAHVSGIECGRHNVTLLTLWQAAQAPGCRVQRRWTNPARLD